MLPMALSHAAFTIDHPEFTLQGVQFRNQAIQQMSETYGPDSPQVGWVNEALPEPS